MAGEAEKIIYDATTKGDATTFQDVLEKDPYLLDGASFSYSRNLLHIATIWEQVTIVEDLLRRNLKLAEDVDSKNSSPLHIAAAKGNLQIASMLFRVAPDMCWSLDGQGMNPIHIAAKNGHVEVMEYLLQLNPSPAVERLNRGRTVLHLCVKHGQFVAFQILVGRLGELVRVKDDDGDTLLHWAARYNQLEIAAMLLPVATEICWSVDGQGMNPIHIAAMKGHVEILENLLGVNPSPAMERVYRGQTVLHLCVKHGQLRALQILVEKLGDLIHAKDDDGETVLHWAVRFNQLQMVQYLVQSTNIDVLTKNSMGYSPDKILQEMPPNHTTSEIKKILKKTKQSLIFVVILDSGIRDAMMIVLALITTVAFQAMVTPPGGVWQDDSSTHHAGEAVMASNRPRAYRLFVASNTIAFVAALVAMSVTVLQDGVFAPVLSRIAVPAFNIALYSVGLSYGASLMVIHPKSVSLTMEFAFKAYSAISFLLLVVVLVVILWKKRKSRH